MRSLSVISTLVAFAAARNWADVDTDWATAPDATADWYKEHGEPLPELADPITTIDENRSYVVKLECVGCPFRIRKPLDESWQDPPRDNSLLFNFTVGDGALLLNGRSIAPLAPMPLDIQAFQTHANFSRETMNKVSEMQMLDDSWNLGTKFARFDLQYEHSVVGTKQTGKTWIQFDVLGAHLTSYQYPRSYMLDKEGQEMVQVLMSQHTDQQLYIEDIQVVARKDRVQPYMMDCGRLAILQTQYNPLEWDYYGKFGTVTRSWHLLLWKTGNFVSRNGLLLIIMAIVFCAVKLVRRRVDRLRQKSAVDDAEFALLAPEYEEGPPQYDDVPEQEDKA